MSARAARALFGAALAIGSAASEARADEAAIEEGAVEAIVDEAAADAAPRPASDKPDAWAALGADVRMRKVVVAGFDGKGALRLRQAVLDALSEHGEIEIVGSKDVEVSGKSRGLSPNDAGDREVLSKELGIYAWVLLEDGGTIVMVDAEGEQLARLRAGDHSGSEADLQVKIWSTFGPHVSDQGLRAHLLERLRTSAAGKLKAIDQEGARQIELALARQERRAAHLAASKQRALSTLEAHKAVVAEQQQLAMARVQREEEQARQAELAQQAQLAQQAEAARQAELAQQQRLARQQQQQQAAKQPSPAYAQPTYATYPAPDNAASWQPGRAQPVFAQPTPQQPAYVEPAQPSYGPQPATAPASPAAVEAAPSSAMPVSAATQAWLERRRAQQQLQQQ